MLKVSNSMGGGVSIMHGASDGRVAWVVKCCVCIIRSPCAYEGCFSLGKNRFKSVRGVKSHNWRAVLEIQARWSSSPVKKD